MLERLDHINWAQLQCFCGTAAHVPGAIRLLTSADPSVVEDAYWHLENHVIAQGTLYEAAEHVTEFLLEVLTAAPFKGAVLELLFQIGSGTAADPALSARCRSASISALERWLQDPNSQRHPSFRELALADLAELRGV